MPFGVFVAQNFEPLVLPTLKPATREIYSLLLRKHILPRFRDSRLREISRADIQKFLLEKLKDGYAWETTDHFRGVLSRVLRTAVEWTYLSDNPVHGVKMPERSLKRPHRFLSLDEKRLLETLEEPTRTVVLLAAMTGLRIGEILALRWGRINFASGTFARRRDLLQGNIRYSEDAGQPARSSDDPRDRSNVTRSPCE